MVSRSPKMRKVFELIEQVGPIGSTVLIQGETGTGKELVARAVHAADTRRSGPFVALNCAVLTTARSRASYSGTRRVPSPAPSGGRSAGSSWPTAGRCCSTRPATSRPALQAKLLRVLQTGQFERVGGTETIQVEVRIIAASHKILRTGGQEGPVPRRPVLPPERDPDRPSPVRDRSEDIPLLAMHFLQQQHQAQSQGGTQVTEIATDAMQALLRHTWPGNVRELENAIKAGVALADGPVLRRDDLPESVAPRTANHPRGSSLIDIDRPLPEVTGELISQVDARVLRPAPLAIQGKCRPMRPAQRPIAAERHPEAPEVRPGRTEFKGPRRRAAQ